jgi:hypothetical protein
MNINKFIKCIFALFTISFTAYAFGLFTVQKQYSAQITYAQYNEACVRNVYRILNINQSYQDWSLANVNLGRMTDDKYRSYWMDKSDLDEHYFHRGILDRCMTVPAEIIYVSCDDPYLDAFGSENLGARCIPVDSLSASRIAAFGSVVIWFILVFVFPGFKRISPQSRSQL